MARSDTPDFGLPKSEAALLVLDMFSDFRFPDGPAVLRAAAGAATAAARALSSRGRILVRFMAALAAVATPSLLLALLVALSPALAQAAETAVEGTLDVSITGPALKHWGIPGAAAAFVPVVDRSPYAQRIREAVTADALCAALAQVDGRDAAIASAHVDGDGDLEHGSSDEIRLVFRIGLGRLAAAESGVVYFCSSPIVAVVGRGSYPDERFETVTDQRFRWVSSPVTLRAGAAARVLGMASIDASRW